MNEHLQPIHEPIVHPNNSNRTKVIKQKKNRKAKFISESQENKTLEHRQQITEGMLFRQDQKHWHRLTHKPETDVQTDYRSDNGSIPCLREKQQHRY